MKKPIEQGRTRCSKNLKLKIAGKPTLTKKILSGNKDWTRSAISHILVSLELVATYL